MSKKTLLHDTELYWKLNNELGLNLQQCYPSQILTIQFCLSCTGEQAREII